MLQSIYFPLHIQLCLPLFGCIIGGIGTFIICNVFNINFYSNNNGTKTFAPKNIFIPFGVMGGFSFGFVLSIISLINKL